MAHDSGGYASYAPNGNIRIESGLGWSNPDFKDSRTSAHAYSGVPLIIAGKGRVEVQRLPHGSVHSLTGPITVPKDRQNLALAFQGSFPMKTLSKRTCTKRGENSKLRQFLGIRTSDITGPTFAGPLAVLNLLRTRDYNSLNFRLQQGMQFPFPVIPSYSKNGPFFDVWFHVPYPPDMTQGGSSSPDPDASTIRSLETLQTEIESLESQVQTLNSQRDSTSDPTERQRLKAEIDLLRIDLADKQRERDALARQIQAEDTNALEEVERLLTDRTAPVTRDDDKNISDTGQKGWNYSRLINGVLGFLVNMATFNFDALESKLSGMGADVRLVHFGGRFNEPDFRFQNGFHAKSSWTVPPGRGFKFNGNMTITGDLWLQKGSVVHITGGLELRNPDISSSEPLEPSGKLVLEEGASLIVGGDLRLAGDARYGSIWTCSPLGKVTPVSSAIFVVGVAKYRLAPFLRPR